MKELIDILQAMSHSTLNNYIVPGLQSSLIGSETMGKVRVFNATRAQRCHITPHSHRFDFACLVLRGSVINTIWEEHDNGDLYQCTNVKYKDAPGKYDILPKESTQDNYCAKTFTYEAGDTYSMNSNQIHSISFSRDSVVLFFEGPQLTDKSLILEPIVEGEVIPTGNVEPWMFRK